MKIRSDLTAYSLTGLCVVALVALTIAGHEIPELLSTITLVSLGVSGGAAAPTHLTGRTADLPAEGDTSSAPDRKIFGPLPVATLPPAPAGAGDLSARTAAPAGAAPVIPAPVIPAPAGPVPGRDWTETFPAITPAMIAADRAQS